MRIAGQMPEQNRVFLKRVWRATHLECSCCKPHRNDNAGPKKHPKVRVKRYWPRWTVEEA